MAELATAPRALVVLLLPKWRSGRRRGVGERGRFARAALVLVIGAIAWPLMYTAFFRLLRALRGVPEVGPLLAAKLLGVGLLLFLGILFLSNLVGALSSFFLARDLPVLLAAPTDWLSLYWARLTETLVSSSWMVVLLMLPVVVAYERVYEAGAAFYGLAVVTVVPFLVIPAALGSAGTLVLVRVFPARRSRDILGLVSIGAVAMLVLGLRVIRPERLVDPEGFRNLVDFLAVLRGPSSPWLASQWGADALTGWLDGPFDPFPLLLLWSTAAGVVVLGAALHRRLYSTCFTKAQEGAEGQIRRGAGWRGVERLLAKLPVARRHLILKDVRLFFRDTTQWSQLIILAVLVVVYVYNINVLPLRSGPMIGRYLVTIIVFLNLALTGFVLAAIAARFVFPALSLEGRTLWLLGSAPIDARSILWSKFWVGALPIAFLAVLLTALTNILLGVQGGLLALSLASVVALSLAFTSQALSWGVFYPEFESENAAQIPTSLGGLLFMLCALGSLALVVGVQVWSLRGFLLSGLPGRPSREPLAAELWVAALLTVTILALLAILPYRAAIARLRDLRG
ncbi:MAG: hypothetical protein ACE5HF_08290 [Gemmatimonadota bacterium]